MDLRPLDSPKRCHLWVSHGLMNPMACLKIATRMKLDRRLVRILVVGNYTNSVDCVKKTIYNMYMYVYIYMYVDIDIYIL